MLFKRKNGVFFSVNPIKDYSFFVKNSHKKLIMHSESVSTEFFCEKMRFHLWVRNVSQVGAAREKKGLFQRFNVLPAAG